MPSAVRESSPGLLLGAHAGLTVREPSLAMWTQTTDPVILLLGLFCLQDNHRKHTRTVSAILLMFKPWQRPKCPLRLNYGRIRWQNEVCENWLGHVTLIQMWEQKQETAEPANSSFQILRQLDLWRHIDAYEKKVFTEWCHECIFGIYFHIFYCEYVSFFLTGEKTKHP